MTTGKETCTTFPVVLPCDGTTEAKSTTQTSTVTACKRKTTSVQPTQTGNNPVETFYSSTVRTKQPKATVSARGAASDDPEDWKDDNPPYYDSDGEECQAPDTHDAILIPRRTNVVGSDIIRARLKKANVAFHEITSTVLDFVGFLYVIDLPGHFRKKLDNWDEVSACYVPFEEARTLIDPNPNPVGNNQNPAQGGQPSDGGGSPVGSSHAKERKSDDYGNALISTPKDADFLNDDKKTWSEMINDKRSYNHWYNDHPGVGQAAYIIERGIWKDHIVSGVPRIFTVTTPLCQG
jgi:hypothetical protein